MNLNNSDLQETYWERDRLRSLEIKKSLETISPIILTKPDLKIKDLLSKLFHDVYWYYEGLESDYEIPLNQKLEILCNKLNIEKITIKELDLQ